MILKEPTRTDDVSAFVEAPVLLVDGDGVSRRFVELCLGPTGIPVESARDGTGALEILRTTRASLIVADTELPDMNGLQFFRRLTQESRLRTVPFVFYTADQRVGTKVVAFRAGADEYWLKPADPSELVARVQSLLRRQRRLAQVIRQRSYTLAGEFRTIGFPDLLSILEMGRRTGTLAIATPSATGEVVLEEGRVVHATYGTLTGNEAFYRLMSEEDGQFELSAGKPAAPEGTFTISEPITALIMEAARRFDEVTAAGGREARPGPVILPESAPKPQSVGPLAPNRSAVIQFEQEVSDGFSLGELKLWSADDLTRWTRDVAGRDRLHAFLIADLPAGISGMLTVAAPPSERWVLEALSPAAKCGGLAFHLRHERVLDVVLINIRHANAFRRSLQRTPSFVILAPPDGDALAVGPQARVELIELLREIPPPAILGVGHPSVDRMLETQSRHIKCKWKSIRGAINEGRADLRTLLVEGIRLWGTCQIANPASSQAG